MQVGEFPCLEALTLTTFDLSAYLVKPGCYQARFAVGDRSETRDFPLNVLPRGWRSCSTSPPDYIWSMDVNDAARPASDAAMNPVIEFYKRGIDRTLLRENLRKTPTERVRSLMALQRLAEEAKRAGRRLAHP